MSRYPSPIFPALEKASRQALHRHEMFSHLQVVDEYAREVTSTMLDLLLRFRPNAETLKQQPYMSPATRYRLLDFAYRVLTRLKLLPFVYFRAIRLFDRYCSKRVVLGDQIRLIISTCLWIAAKIHGGNNHFETEPDTSHRKYGPPIKYVSHPGRFRLPRLLELVNLCGSKCLYDAGMFKQMEVHIFSTLQWQVSDPSIDDYLSLSNETIHPQVPMPSQVLEMSRTKEFLSNIALCSYQLVDTSNDDLAQVILDFINEMFGLTPSHSNFQVFSMYVPANLPLLIEYNPQRYTAIKDCLIEVILNCHNLALFQLSTSGPRYLYQQVCATYGKPSASRPPMAPPNTADPHLTELCSEMSSSSPEPTPSSTRSPSPSPESPSDLDESMMVDNVGDDIVKADVSYVHQNEPPAIVARLVRALGNVTLQTVTHFPVQVVMALATLFPGNLLLTLVSLLALSQGVYNDLFEVGSARRGLPASELPSPLDSKLP